MITTVSFQLKSF